MSAAASSIELFLRSVAGRAGASGVFGAVEVRTPPLLVCRAKRSASAASYRVWVEGEPGGGREGGRVWVSLVTADRWLSESIESDLVHTGDKLEDLLEEELADLGHGGGERARFEHFRSDDLLFTFRTPVPARVGDAGAAEVAAGYLLAYEACFRRLGDMDVRDAGVGEV